jgi:uncharacterized protein involved in exopolysaccharide biosynthesis
LWYWRLVHYLSIIRLRRRIVFGAAVLGCLIATIFTIRPVYSSRATIRDNGVDAQGVITNPPQDHSSSTNGSDYSY